jgi:predicted TIM-barrel fold metal-dependent hydrolase
MVVDRIKTGQMYRLLQRYPEARFVLMHIAYPYNDELIAMAKHFPNAWVDLCWAWSINPYASSDFVRRFLHAVPINKLFAFGGDTMWPTSSLAYAHQARQGLTRALEAEIQDGSLTENEAIETATRLMRDNCYNCFDVTGTRAALQAASTQASA